MELIFYMFKIPAVDKEKAGAAKIISKGTRVSVFLSFKLG